MWIESCNALSRASVSASQMDTLIITLSANIRAFFPRLQVQWSCSFSRAFAGHSFRAFNSSGITYYRIFA